MDSAANLPDFCLFLHLVQVRTLNLKVTQIGLSATGERMSVVL